MAGRLDKLEEALFGRSGRREAVEDDPVQEWRDLFGEEPPPVMKRLFSIPIEGPPRGFSRQELREAGVDLADVLQAIGVAAGMATPEEIARSADRGPGRGREPGDRGEHGALGLSDGRTAEEAGEVPPEQRKSPLQRRPRTL